MWTLFFFATWWVRLLTKCPDCGDRFCPVWTLMGEEQP